MVDIETLSNLIEMGESTQCEFKADRGKFNDSVLFDEVVAMANSIGGVILIGVEDNGKVTGAKPRNGGPADSMKVQAAIFNNTVPHINTRVSVINHPDGIVIAIEVDSYPEICATASGKCLRRIIGGDGKPATVPFYPPEQLSRKSDLGLLDISARLLEDLRMDALDQLEFERLRQTIASLHGEQALLALNNEELAKALKLVESKGRKLIPNLAGLLVLGRQSVLETVLPNHVVFFQFLDEHGDVKVNDRFTYPLLRTLEEIQLRFAARNNEQEIMVGMFRLPVPDYSPIGFREAITNALIHRDYSRQGSIYLQWQPDHMLLTNPGGFPLGVNPENILVHEPRPRNPRLAEIMLRIGIIEQTGRGVDRIYDGQMRFGRPVPDYSRSDADAVRLVLYGGKGSLQFAAFVFEQDKSGQALTLDELLVLNHLLMERRIDSEKAGQLIQKGTRQGHFVLEKLTEKGLIEAKGERRGRIYHLSAGLYAKLGNPYGYVRTRGFDSIQQEQMILKFVDKHGTINRSQASELCKISKDQAYRLLRKLCDQEILVMKGKSRNTSFYERKQ